MAARGAGARVLLALLAACAACAAGGRPTGRPDDEHVAAREILGVRYALRVRDDDARRAEAALALALLDLERVALLLHPTQPGGEIALLNAVPSHVWIAVSDETAAAVRRARAVAEASGGYFDPTLGPVRRLWGVGAGADARPRVPGLSALNHALRKVDWQAVEVRDDEPAVRRTSRHLEVDLGALARGATLDAALAALRAAGVPAALAEAPDAHAAYGGSAARPWRVELADPDTGRPWLEVEHLEGGLGVAAARRTVVDGVALHAGIDPWTGRPSQGERLVAVVAPDAASACAWAEALLAMGEAGPRFAREREDLETLVLLESGERVATPGLHLQPPGTR